MATVPEDLAHILADLERGLDRIDSTHEVYAEREAYLTGKATEVFVHKALRKSVGVYGEAFRLNYAAVPVDALDDRIDLSSLNVANDETLTKRIAAGVWEHNDLDDDADAWQRKALGLGDFYVFGWPVEDDEGNATDDIDLFGKSPANAVIIYDRKNRRVPEFGVFYWPEGKKLRATLVYDDAVVELVAPQGGDSGTKPSSQVWELYIDDPDDEADTGILEHDYGFCMFHFRPDAKPYGKPVNVGAYGPQNAITKINASHMAAIDYIGAPQRYALVDGASEVDDDIDDDFDNDIDASPLDAPTDPSKVSKGTGLNSAPGSLWMLKGLKGAGQFEPAQSTPFLEAEAFQIKAMATLTRTPLYEFDQTGEVPSGESRRRADGPITKHAAKIKGTFGQTWSNIGAFVLKAWNVGDEKTVEAVWMPSELATDKEGLELVGMKIENGIPPRQALIEAGYTAEQVDEWMPDTDAPVTPALLAIIAPAIQALAQAVTLGTISAEEVHGLLPQILTGSIPEALVLPEPEVDAFA